MSSDGAALGCKREPDADGWSLRNSISVVRRAFEHRPCHMDHMDHNFICALLVIVLLYNRVRLNLRSGNNNNNNICEGPMAEA